MLASGAPVDIAQRLTHQVVSLPVLTPEGAALLEAEISASASCEPRLVLTRFDDSAPKFPCAAAFADLLAREVLPRLAGYVSGSKVPTRLCRDSLAYILQYRPGADADNGRVFRCHQDDADLTLALCIGSASKS